MRANDKGYPKDAASLEKDIDETREDVRATLEALEQKLSPGQVLDYVVDLARRHGGDYAQSMRKAARQNPVATLLTTMGLAWLLTATRPDEEAEARRAGRAIPADKGMAPEGATRARAKRFGLDHLVHEQPLLIGAIGVAVGAIVGAALKPSRDTWYLADLLEEEEEAARQEAAAAATAGVAEEPRPWPEGDGGTRPNGPTPPG